MLIRCTDAEKKQAEHFLRGEGVLLYSEPYMQSVCAMLIRCTDAEKKQAEHFLRGEGVLLYSELRMGAFLRRLFSASVPDVGFFVIYMSRVCCRINGIKRNAGPLCNAVNGIFGNGAFHAGGFGNFHIKSVYERAAARHDYSVLYNITMKLGRSFFKNLTYTLAYVENIFFICAADSA